VHVWFQMINMIENICRREKGWKTNSTVLLYKKVTSLISELWKTWCFSFFLSYFFLLFLDKQNSPISNKNSKRINDNSLEHYFGNLGSRQGKPMGNIFGVHSQCRSKIFLSGSKWVNMVVRTFRVEVAGVQIMSVIFLILGAWPSSRQGSNTGWPNSTQNK
jgi:hypothetical protein